MISKKAINDAFSNSIMTKFLKNPFTAANRLREIELEAGRFREIFVEQPYYWLYKKIKPLTTLIDIGANIGDTALYFAMNPNTKEVIAFEPDEEHSMHAKRLLSASALNSKIRWNNAKVGGAEGFSLSSIIDKLSNVAIKADCEGCEYNIFNKDIKLDNVYAIILEYHYGYAEIEKAIRNNGFRTEHTDPVRMHGFEELGYLYAEREENEKIR